MMNSEAIAIAPKFSPLSALTRRGTVKRILRIFCACFLAGLLLASLTAVVASQESDADPTEEATPAEEQAEPEVGRVTLDGKVLFELEDSIGSITPQARAETAREAIAQLAEDPRFLPEEVVVEDLGNIKLINGGSRLIIALSEEDAEIAGLPLSELAQTYRNDIAEAIVEYRTSRTPEQIVRGAVYAAIATLIVVLLFYAIYRLFPLVVNWIDRWQERNIGSVRLQRQEFVSSDRLGNWLIGLAKFIRTILILIVLYIYIPLLLSFFPSTQFLGARVLNSFWNAVSVVFGGIFGYVPELFIIATICIVTYYFLRFARFFFRAIERGRISFSGFYPEWSQPTFNLLRYLTYALAAVLIFPHLPASDSQGFQSISLFIGALFTLGGASAVANIVSGVIVVYTRAYQPGDRVRSGDVFGDVLDKTLLSTRILTPQNEIVTLPNALLLSGAITNYSAMLRDREQPLVISTTITLGYDVPWRLVHDVLVAAANETSGVLDDPAPVVWQTSLDDFYVSYQLRVYIDTPKKMALISSELHQNLQDKCNEADIEILSPHYRAARDGNQTTIPADYLPDTYEPPSFRIQNITDRLTGRKPD